MHKAKLCRRYEPSQTIGIFKLFDKDKQLFESYSLERVWDNNKPFISCIPVGIYLCRITNSPKFGKCFEILNVPGRDNVLIHPLNFFYDSEGCMGLGESLADINNDGLIDIAKSAKAVEKLESICTEFILEIC